MASGTLNAFNACRCCSQETLDISTNQYIECIAICTSQNSTFKFHFISFRHGRRSYSYIIITRRPKCSFLCCLRWYHMSKFLIIHILTDLFQSKVTVVPKLLNIQLSICIVKLCCIHYIKKETLRKQFVWRSLNSILICLPMKIWEMN